MAREHIIEITNGQGSKELVNAIYTVESNTLGYDNTSILPIEQEISDGVNDYAFTITATGVLTIHVTDSGTDTGNPIVGATFVRCDAVGNEYGNVIASDSSGNAVFNAVPFTTEENAPIIYYKQKTSDGEHTFNTELQNTTLPEATKIIELVNAIAPTRNFAFTDATYSELPIENGQIKLIG